jgi:flagellar basal body-associated protein FliL
MKRKSWLILFAVLLAALALTGILWAVVWFSAKKETAPQPEYYLRDLGGKVALYNGDGTGPLAEYEIYTRLLPQTDVLALQAGVPVQNDAQLQSLLEDYGL